MTDLTIEEVSKDEGEFLNCFQDIGNDKECLEYMRWLMKVALDHLGSPDVQAFKNDLHRPAHALAARMLEMAWTHLEGVNDGMPESDGIPLTAGRLG